MIRIRTSEPMPASAERTWALLTDWESHSRWIPATEVRVLSGDGGLGTTFVGRSALGLALPGAAVSAYADACDAEGAGPEGRAGRPDGLIGRLSGAAAALRGALGRVGFDDPMTVTVLDPPHEGHAGRCEIVKTGSVVLGTAGFTVVPTGADSCSVTWWEDVEVAPTRLTRWADPVVERAAAYGFARVLRAARADLTP